MSEFNIGRLEADSPFGNAGGVVKHPEDVEKMAHTGVGWIEAGSYTLEQRDGNGPNGEVVYYHNPETRETFNSLGMPNRGMDVVETEIPEMVEIAHAFDKPLIVNVAPVGDDPVAESEELVRRAYEAGADGVLLNAGCPNVVTGDGDRHEILSHNAQALGSVLLGLTDVTLQHERIFIRTTPIKTVENLGPQQASWMYHTIVKSGVVSAVFTPNTWLGYKPLDENKQPVLEVPLNIGGKSGPATLEDASNEAAWAIASMRGAGIDTVLSGGIGDGKALARGFDNLKIAAGAGTTFFYESGDWKYDVDKLLWDFGFRDNR